MTVTWTDLVGNTHCASVPLAVPPPLSPGQHCSPDCDLGLRKAVALSTYVTTLTDYILNEDTDDGEEDDEAESLPSEAASTAGAADQASKGSRVVSKELYQALLSLKAEGVVAVPHEALLPAGTPEDVREHYRHAARFAQLRDYLLAEMAACQDASLQSSNQNVLQTVQQMVDLETAEVRKVLARLHCDALPAALEVPVLDHAVPRGFLCPITLELMADPVMAADGHSYERKAITAWLRAHDTSPTTNLPLPHKLLVDNHALRSAIEDFRLKQVAGEGEGAVGGGVEAVVGGK